MPTYEYVCTECGEPLEVVQSIHDPALTECPSCQGRLRKVFGNVGVVFKGGGFYRTDSRSGQKTGSPSKESKAPADSKGSASTAPKPAKPSTSSGSSSGGSSGSSSGGGAGASAAASSA